MPMIGLSASNIFKFFDVHGNINRDRICERFLDLIWDIGKYMEILDILQDNFIFNL